MSPSTYNAFLAPASTWASAFLTPIVLGGTVLWLVKVATNGRFLELRFFFVSCINIFCNFLITQVNNPHDAVKYMVSILIKQYMYIYFL